MMACHIRGLFRILHKFSNQFLMSPIRTVNFLIFEIKLNYLKDNRFRFLSECELTPIIFTPETKAVNIQ